jgi:hypothetical protein
LGVEGEVGRIAAPLRAASFASTDDHLAQLRAHGVARASASRVLVFVRDALATGARDRNTLRYLWLEAGFRQTS